MGLHRFKPMPSGRMGIFWTLSGIRDAAVVEYGCMGHNLYSGGALRRTGIYEGYGSTLYTTYINETDISMGDTSRLDATIREVIKADRPQVIFLQPSAVPEVIGTDMFALAKLMQPEFPDTQLVPIGNGSFAISQHRGVQEALLALARELPRETPKTEKPTYNLIGSCPDLFNFGPDEREIRRVMEGAFGMEPVCVLSSAASVGEIRALGGAHVNLVIRREGVPAAKILKERFGAPYVVGRPYGIQGTTAWLRQVGETLGAAPEREFTAFEEKLAWDQIETARQTLKNQAWSYPEESVLTLGGHADVVRGILRYATEELTFRKGECWCDCPEMGDEEIPYFSEEKWVPVVQNHKKGYLMCSGEALRWAGKNLRMQISTPDVGYHLHPYDPPLVGYRGAVQLVNLWIDEYVLTH